jgi:hypothetical protein
MDNLKRSELKLLIEGLDAVRQRMREDIEVDLGGDEYKEVVRLQDRLIETLESRFY